MKVTELELRRRIRMELLKEYRSAASDYQPFTFASCKIDLPKRFIKGEENEKLAEKTATFAAKLYGIPGEFCNLWNAAFGDNPKRATRDAINEGKKRKKQFAAGFFPTLKTRVDELQTAFIKEIWDNKDNDDDSKEAAIKKCKSGYDSLQAEFDTVRLSDDPTEAGGKFIDLVVESTGIKSGGLLSEMKNHVKLYRDNKFNDAAIVQAMFNEIQDVTQTITRRNLLDPTVKDKYTTPVTGADVEDLYEQFLNGIPR